MHHTNIFSRLAPWDLYCTDRRTTLVQVLMKMSGVLDDEQDCHTTAVALYYCFMGFQ